MQDLLVTVVAFCGFGAAGVLSAMAAKDWNEDVIDPLPSFLNSLIGDLTDIRNDMIATAVSINNIRTG